MTMNEWDVKSIDWPCLTPESVVFEIGGYNGRWAKLMDDKYPMRLYVFEPQLWAYEQCKAKLSPRAQVFNYALGTQDAIMTMYEWGTDGCSFIRSTREKGTGQMREYYTVLNELGVYTIDLMLMNIEGYEFQLLPYLTPTIHTIKNLMVQFHPMNAAHELDYVAIRNKLVATHRILWDYGTMLTAWSVYP